MSALAAVASLPRPKDPNALITAVETAELVDQVPKTHLATIAALSRSMEAKDYYTGGQKNPFSAHERVLEEALEAVRSLDGGRLEEPQALEAGADPAELDVVRLDER